jgi:Protein of unknown function (DUF2924)
MQLNVGKEVAALKRMTTRELRTRYAEAFGEATNANNRAWLVKRIAWRLQVQAEGGLSERARRRADELANDADLRLSPPWVKTVRETPDLPQMPAPRGKGDERVPPPGTIITRRYKGESLQVQVLPDGFEFEGAVFKSLSAVARAITGQHCNGFHFFRMGQEASR